MWDGKRIEEGWTGHVNPVSIQVIDTTPFARPLIHLERFTRCLPSSTR